MDEEIDLISAAVPNPLRIRPGPPVCSGLGKNGVRRGRHLIHTEYLHNYRLHIHYTINLIVNENKEYIE